MASCQGFLEYIKALIKNNKLSIKKDLENQISIEIIVEYLFKQNLIKIDLKSKPINLEKIVKDMFIQLSKVNTKLEKVESNYFELQEKNRNLQEENRTIKEENKNIKDKIIIFQKSLDMLKSDISIRLK